MKKFTNISKNENKYLGVRKNISEFSEIDKKVLPQHKNKIPAILRSIVKTLLMTILVAK
jgi:hypothetical protein